MTAKNTIKILQKHNNWRRNKSNSKMQDSKDIGKAIDIAIKFMKVATKNENIDKYQF